MPLFRLALLSAFAVPSAAQSHVLTVDDGAVSYGSIHFREVDPIGAMQALGTIGDATAGFGGRLSDRDRFGSAVAPIDDLDGNGVVDLAVGATGDEELGGSRGMVWILFLALDGSVLAARPLRSGEPGLGVLPEGGRFGSALAALGDLDGDGTIELAVGAPAADVPGASGEVRILSLRADGSVARTRVLTEGQGGFGGSLEPGDAFGSAVAALGDRDGDGVMDLAVGAAGDDRSGLDVGALWLLRMSADGSALSETSIHFPSFYGRLARGGSSVCVVGDVDADGIPDLALGAPRDSYSGDGLVHVLFMNADGSVRSRMPLGQNSAGVLDFGAAVAPLGDLDADGVPDLAVGARGAVFVLLLDADGRSDRRHIEYGTGGIGSSLAALGDLDLDGSTDLAVGAKDAPGVPSAADFTSLQAAVDAAANGDVLLLRGGVYESATVDGKALTIVGENRHEVNVRSLVVRNLASSQTTVLSDLRSGLFSSVPDALITLQDDLGPVWIEDVHAQAESTANDLRGLRVTGCTDVVLIRSHFGAGGNVSPQFRPQAAPGLVLSGGSAVQAYDCSFLGDDGGAYFNFAQTGGVGVRVSSADDFLFLSGCSAQGGSGLDLGTSCSSGGAGLETAGEAFVLDTALTGGPGGSDGSGSCAPAGAPQVGTVTSMPGEALRFSTGPLAREGEDVVYSFRGPPNTPVWLMGSPFTRPEWRRPLRGSLLSGTPRAIRFMGTTNANGELEVLVPLGLLPPGWDVRRTFLQPLMIEGARGGDGPELRDRASRVTLGTGSAFVVLDNSF